MDALTASSSLTNRRQAATGLPNFELPPPNALQFAAPHSQKYPPLTQTHHHPASAAVSVGNLLTSPSNSASDSSTGSSSVHTGASPNSAGPPVLPYTPTFFGGGGNAGFHSGLTPQGWQTTNSLFPPPRPVFSQMSGSMMRHNTTSPATAETAALPPPPYDLSSGSYPGHFGLASSPGASLSSQPPTLTNSLGGNGLRSASQQSPIASDPVGTKPPASSIYANMPPSHVHSTAYSYSNSTPVSQSPLSASGPGVRHSPQINQMQTSQSQSPFIRAPYPSYTLPNMPGPAMSNLTSPGAQMSMVGNVGAVLPMSFNSGYAASPTSLYGNQRTNSPVHNPQNDRPFRCDSCPQSFHRNHDLKRHKRIHLAVKPFPCKHCDKSFSRKDALKRHILVKGCGNRGSMDENKDDGSKSESGSDRVTSPVIAVGA
ncbi:hypothetical protein DV738_g877, partial [Chaetothyriales sp. CBS 135597]